MQKRVKLLRVTTVPISLKVLLKGQLAYMSEFYDVVAVSSEGDELQDVANQDGIRVKAIGMTRKITPIKDFVALMKMILFFMYEQPSIVHTHTPKAGLLGMIAAWVTRVPCRLHTVAGLPVMEADGNKKRLLFLMEKLTYLCATIVYPNSYGLKDYIVCHNLTVENKLKVIGCGSSNGIDTSYFDRTKQVEKEATCIRKKLGLNDSFVFCFVGRVVKDKGVDELLVAFNQLSKSFDDVRLLIVGCLEEDLNPIAQESHEIIERNKHVIHVGYQDDIRPYLAASNCFVFPSYREGFPNVVMQAGAMGLASIVSDINGCNEIITHGENGLIVPRKDKKELETAMLRLIKAPKLLHALGEEARARIVSRYEQKGVWQAIKSEYDRCLE